MTLAAVATGDLLLLRTLIANGTVTCPLTESSLRAQGLSATVTSLVSALPFESSDVLLRTLDLVLEERARGQRPPLELVWSGPMAPAPQTRDTAVVLAEMFSRATKRVLLAGYVFTHGASILQPLHAALQRGVTARFFLDIPGEAATVAEIDDYARGQIRDFLSRNWPFGPPHPVFFYDPRTASPLERAILHAKCAVVDGRHALVTSANFTNAAQKRNIEVGVLIDDEIFATRLEGQFNALVSQKALVEVAP